MIKEAIIKLKNGEHLAYSEAEEVMREIISWEFSEGGVS